ncbi:MAG: LLM class flavin-dependent oxidoreductase [Acidimicrobiales bacterium]
MHVGMTLPSMVETYDRATTLEWCARIDGGPFSSVAVGERITFHNQEQLVCLAAAAALTSRVRIMATIVILPMHPVALVAKQMATLDVLSGGRLSVGVGIGGRDHDYRAAGAPVGNRLQRLDEGVAELRRLWRGEPPFDGAAPVGPRPVHAGGPPVLCSSMGPKSLSRAARWAEGLVGFTVSGDPGELMGTAERVKEAWVEAGRQDEPYLITSAWCSMGPDAEARHHAYVSEYLAVAPDLAPYMVSASNLHTEARIARAMDAAEDAGFDEFVIVPTTGDLAELDRFESLVRDR